MCSPGNYVRQKNYRFVLGRKGDQIFSKFEIKTFPIIPKQVNLKLWKKSEKKHFIIFCFSLFLNCSPFPSFSSPPSPFPPPPPPPLLPLLLLFHPSFPLLLLYLKLLLPFPPSPPPPPPAPPPPPPSALLMFIVYLLFLLISCWLICFIVLPFGTLLFFSSFSSYFPPSFLLLWLFTLSIFIPSWKFCWKTPGSLCNPSNLIRLG